MSDHFIVTEDTGALARAMEGPIAHPAGSTVQLIAFRGGKKRTRAREERCRP